MIIPKLASALAYGGDYNPEQWPESVWSEDMRLMREAGVNLVTVGVFSWSHLQPTEHRYEFDWLDRVMDLLAEHDIYVDLATGTASPPPWMSRRYPEVLAVDASGVVLHPGSRQHYSPCSPVFRELAAALVSRLAERYRTHPALAAWHVNNEFGNHVTECHGAAATAAFRSWLQRRYETLDALNHAWGTAFWSQRYAEWDEILTPRRTPTFPNPPQQLDYRRFMSDAVLELFLQERAILRAATPDVPVTTNYLGFHKPMNYQRWSPELDFVAWDNYPEPLLGTEARQQSAAGHDLTRSLKHGRPFLLMEQSVSHVTWREVNGAKPPGLLRLWSWQAVARGADGVMFFQWRASRAGAEKFLGGMVSHVPASQSRTFAEVCTLGAELARMSPVVGSRLRARVAIAFDWEAWWAVELDAKPTPVAYASWAQEIHACLYARNIAVDFVHPDDELAGYAAVIAPSLYLLTEKSAGNLQEFVHAGGFLLVTSFSGIVDRNDHVVLGGYPALLREVLGLWVEEWFPLASDDSHLVRSSDPNLPSFHCTHCCDAVHLVTARALAAYAGPSPLAGRATITANVYGRGTACYLGTRPDAAGLSALLAEICRRAGVQPLLETPAGVEATLREQHDAEFLFLLNHRDDAVPVALGTMRGPDLLTGRACAGVLTLSAYGVAILRLERRTAPIAPHHPAGAVVESVFRDIPVAPVALASG